MGITKIPWADKTWNPITGCTPISEGCQHCYARRFATRLAGRYGYGARAPFHITLHPDRLYDPGRWRKPARIFVCSMGDIFHPDIPDYYLDSMFDVMIDHAPWHQYFILTKRPHQLQLWADLVPFDKFDHIWLGITAENQARANERIPLLLSVHAPIHFISVEPALGPVLLQPEWMGANGDNRIDWIIWGPETGPRRRPADLAWRDQLFRSCLSAGLYLFDKSKTNPVIQEWPMALPQRKSLHQVPRIRNHKMLDKLRKETTNANSPNPATQAT